MSTDATDRKRGRKYVFTLDLYPAVGVSHFRDEEPHKVEVITFIRPIVTFPTVRNQKSIADADDCL